MHMGANTSRCWRGWRQGREKGHVERRAAPHGWEWLARGRVKRPGCVIRSWTGGRRVPAVRGPSPTLDTPEVPITLKPRKCTSLRCAPARGAAEAERRQGPASGLSWERGAAGHTSVTLSRPQTRAAREALEMPRSTGRNPARLSRERHGLRDLFNTPPVISSGSTRAIARAPRPCRQPTRQTRTSARPTPATRKPPRVGAFGSGRAMLRRSCKTSRTATTPSMLLRHPSAKALQHAHSTLFRSRPRGRSPPRRPTCLLGAALWDRNESRRNLEAGETLLLCSGRPGFLRKVFALVSTQLLATVAVCALFMCAAPEHARARTLARTHAYVATGRRATPCRTPPHTHL